MDWMPNEDAITYFATQVLPLIKKEIPQVTLTVVGRKPTRKVLALASSNSTIRVTGGVDDIRPYVHKASVYVVPLRIGGGTRIKIFEAMSMSKPVVSTTVGAEGLPVVHGKNILLADTPESFATGTVELLKHPQTRHLMGQAARALVESRYGWSTVADIFEQALLRATRRRSPH